MLRSELIEILKNQIKEFGDKDVVTANCDKKGYFTEEIKKVMIDANNCTIIDISK